jgi:hypothetical protein
MLILNAPGFFSMFWGLIKKFVDPRTAQRIQVFSSREKGLAAPRKLVAVEEIPVDNGGTNKSVKQAFMEERLISASEHAATSAPSASGATKDFRRQYSAPIDHVATQRSQRFLRLVQRSTLEQEHELQAPRVKIPLQGYPELQECVRMSC